MKLPSAPSMLSLFVAAVLPVTAAVKVGAQARTMPDLVGVLVEDANVELEPLGADVIVDKVRAPQGVGVILLQVPEPGEPLGQNGLVFLRVSDGVVMPDLNNLTEAEARAVLDAAGVAVVVTEPTPSAIGKSVVVNQFPPAGARIDAAIEVATLVLTPQIVVPDFKGIAVGAAKEKLGSLGLVATATTAEVRPPRPGKCSYYAETVTNSDPAAGTLLRPSSEVVLHYGFALVTFRPCEAGGYGPGEIAR